jgi:uncharacterized protein (DUF2141 family)
MKYAIPLFFSVMIVSSFRHEESGSLTVSLSNIKKTGKVHVALYKKCENFPDAKFVVKSVSSECKGSCSLQFESVPFGEYAIAVYQDVNSNDKLDTGMFGIPSEPFAFSNNFRPKFGGPSFEKCRFEFVKDKQDVQIQMINSLFGGD